MGLALLGVSQARRGLPGPGFAPTLVVFGENKPSHDLATGGTRQGRFVATRSAGLESARAARFVN